MSLHSLYRVLQRARVLWLVFSSGRSWYRGGLRGWAGSSGRLDIVARVFIAACYPCCVARRGCLFAAHLSGPALLVLEAEGSACYEHEAGRVILDALRGRRGLLVPGLSGVEFAALAVSTGFKPLVLREGCETRWPSSIEGRLVVLGADIDPPPGLEDLGGECISVGPKSYLASVVAALLNVLESLDS